MSPHPGRGDDEHPLVDVVLPVHRARADWLRAAGASLRAQSFPGWHLHVVEDGCPDRSAAALEADWPTDDHRLTVDRLPERRGQVDARSRAIARGTAPWVALLDQDDEYEPDKLAAQLDATAGGAQVVFVDVTHVDPDGAELAERTEFGIRSRHHDALEGLARDDLVAALFAGNVIDFPSALVARDAYDRVGGFDTRHPGGEDWAFWVELAAAGSSFAHVPRRLYRKRAHPESDGARTLDERNLGYYDMALALRRRHGIDGPAAEQREQDLRRRAARSAMVLHRRREAARLLAAMVAAGQAREVAEVVADAVPAVGRIRERRNRG